MWMVGWMSFNCYWEPVPPPSANRIPIGFKYVVARRWFDHDGTLRGEIVLDRDSLAYLRGLMDAAEERTDIHIGAKMLVDAIEKHGQVRFWIGPEDG